MKTSLIITAALAIAFAGCNNSKKMTKTASGNPVSIADAKKAIEGQLDAAGLKDVKVAMDEGKELITLTGTVASEPQRQQAEKIAQDNASTMQIGDEIGLRPPGVGDKAAEADKSYDQAIEDTIKAKLIEQGWNKLGVEYKSVNRAVELDGTVKTQKQRDDLQAMVQAVPNVREVINKIQVKE